MYWLSVAEMPEAMRPNSVARKSARKERLETVSNISLKIRPSVSWRAGGGGDHAVSVPAGDVEHAHRNLRRRHQQEPEQQDLDRQAAEPGEEIAKRHQRGARVIVLREFSREGCAGHFVEGEGEAHEDRGGEEPEEEIISGNAGWRVPCEEVGDGNRDQRGVHEGVAAAVFCAQVVGPVADDRIGDRVDNQGDQQDDCDKPRIDAQNVRVEEQENVFKPVVLDAGGSAPDPEGYAREKAWLGSGRCRHRGIPEMGSVIGLRGRAQPSP